MRGSARSEAKNFAKKSASILKSELLYFLDLFWRAFWKTTVIVSGLMFAHFLIDWIVGGESVSFGNAVIIFFVMLAYDLIVGAHFGLIAGGLRVAWAMAGPFIAVPVILIPLSVALSFWLFGEILTDSAARLLASLAESGSEHDWLVAKLGPVARAGPVALVFALPLLAVDLVAVLLDVAVLFSLLFFLLLVSLAFLAGFIPSALISFAVLIAAYVVRFKRRHRSAPQVP